MYDLEFPFDIIIFVLQIFSIIGFFWAASKINLLEFLGVSQIKRYMMKNYDVNELDEILELKIEGPFLFTRHPIYLFSIFFLALRPTMDVFCF